MFKMIFTSLFFVIGFVGVVLATIMAIINFRDYIQERREVKEVVRRVKKLQKESDMPIKVVIDTLQIAIAEVEWNYPLEYAIAFEEAIKILKEVQEKGEKQKIDKRRK